MFGLIRHSAWVVPLFLILPAPAAQLGDADAAFAALNKTYWDPSLRFFHKSETDSRKANFWIESQLWDTVMDQFERTHAEGPRKQIGDVYDGFIAAFPDWTTNRFNDDILWWSIACTRAYCITHEDRYLQRGKASFDSVYDHYCDSTLGGGIYWVKNGKSKHSCVNGPAIIAAARLAESLSDPSYLEKAKSLYAWQKATLTDGKGKVFDNIHYDVTQQKNVIGERSYTYNQGTFIGAGVVLYLQTKDQAYLEDAIRTTQWTRDNLCVGEQRILPDEHQGDGGAFKGILIRYINRLIVDGGCKEFLPWMQVNAEAAWQHRRAGDNLMGSDWSKPAGDQIECQTDASAVAAVIDFASLPTR